MRLLVAALFAGCLAISGQQGEAKKEAEKLAPYYPTPMVVVDKMLKLGELKPGEKMFDLGSGDGRLVIMAAKKFKADATGVEFDDVLYRKSSEEIKRQKLERQPGSSMAIFLNRTTPPRT